MIYKVKDNSTGQIFAQTFETKGEAIQFINDCEEVDKVYFSYIENSYEIINLT